MNEPFHVHDFRGDYPCNWLRARKVWQVLFNEYRANGGDLDRMDNMLCDLAILRVFFDKFESFRLYFDFVGETTDLRPDWYMVTGDCIEIHYDQDAYKVFFYHRTTDELFERQRQERATA